jgi:hypothetical protein
MKLFEIHEKIEAILAEGTDLETGEITEEALEALEELEEAKGEKVLAVAAYLKGERCEAEAIANEAHKLMARAKIHENRAERLIKYIAFCIERGEKFSDARSEVKWIKSQRLEIAEGTDLPKEFMRIKRIVEPDKRRLREALKEGEEIDGVWMQPHQTLVVK